MLLTDFVKIYKTFTLDECKKIVGELNQHNWEKHKFYNAQDGSTVTRETDLEMSHDAYSQHEDLMQSLWNTIFKYITDLNYPWYNQWNSFTPPRFNRYVLGTEMAKHCDHIHSVFNNKFPNVSGGIPVLSIVCLLNEEFSGGEFILNDTEINLTAGDVLVFPSNFMYPHEVRKITAGERYSFVSWVW